jgi:tetratricopeptide (TPR) repeat protein
MNELHAEVIEILNSIKELSRLHHENLRHTTSDVNWDHGEVISETQQVIEALEIQLYQKLQEHQCILQFAIQSHKNHDLVTAEREYKRYLSLGNINKVAYMNLGVIAQSHQDFEVAITYYQASLEIDPDYLDAYINLGILRLKCKSFNRAVKIFKVALNLGAKQNIVHHYLAHALVGSDALKEAIIHYQKALDLTPHHAKLHNDLGFALFSDGQICESIKQYHYALTLQKNFPEALYNLGQGYFVQERYTDALHYFQHTLTLKPNDFEALHYKALTLQHMQKITIAFESWITLIHIASHHARYHIQCVEFIKQYHNILIEESVDLLNEVLIVLLQSQHIDHSDLWGVIKYLLPLQKAQSWLNIKKSQFQSTSTVDLTHHHLLVTVSQHKLLQLSLQKFYLASNFWETFCCTARYYLCAISNQQEIFDRSLIQSFLYALSEQCFLNEYVYYTNKEEQHWIQSLHDLLFTASSFTEWSFALLGCYAGLNTFPEIQSFLTQHVSSHALFNDLIQLQLHEPLQESQLSLQIQSLGSISNQISQSVQNQYEANPYPRWRSTHNLIDQAGDILNVIATEIGRSEIIQETDQIIKINDDNQALKQILIAGCGTGLQLLQAQRYRDVQITAIDLSRASIAYAMRKSKEYMMNNVHFLQADILNLPTLERTFDLIECCGVLHHMENPQKGLSVLCTLLKPNGYMKLALYSEYARQPVVTARHYIQQKKYSDTTDDMRACRHYIFQSPTEDLLYQISKWHDFYSLSNCRDLIFHVQEHRFTIPMIDTMLQQNDLEFIGFIIPSNIQKAYLKYTPNDPKMINLHHWHLFEQSHPSTFKLMYQFWVRKTV